MASETVAANHGARLSSAVLTRPRENAGISRTSVDSNVQLQVLPEAQQSLEAGMGSVCMVCGKPVPAQFPQQSCPASAGIPPRDVKKQTSRSRVPSRLDLRYRFMRFSLILPDRIELIFKSVKPKVN